MNITLTPSVEFSTVLDMMRALFCAMIVVAASTLHLIGDAVRQRAFLETSPPLQSGEHGHVRRGFAGVSPGYGFRGWHQTLVHFPAYVRDISIICLTSYPLFLCRCFCHWLKNPHGRFAPEPSDADICDYLMNSPIYILATVIEGEHGEELLEIYIPDNTGIEDQCRGNIAAQIAASHLCVRWDPLIRVVTHATYGKDRCGYEENDGRWDLATLDCITPWRTRNDILMSALHIIVTTWVHPCTHRLAEMSAMEIKDLNVELLEPSSRFVESLHEGLLYASLSPAAENNWNPFHTGTYVDAIRETVKRRPVPSHYVSDPRKLTYSEYFSFLVHMRWALVKIVKKYNLSVNVEYLFHNLVVHGIDHHMTHETLLHMSVPTSSNGTCTFWSYVQMFNYVHVWLPPKHNTWMEHEKVSCMDSPFYKDLFFEARKRNPVFAEWMVTSCSF